MPVVFTPKLGLIAAQRSEPPKARGPCRMVVGHRQHVGYAELQEAQVRAALDRLLARCDMRMCAVWRGNGARFGDLRNWSFPP